MAIQFTLVVIRYMKGNIDYMGNILQLYFKNGQFCLQTDFILCKKEQRVDNHRYTNKCCFVV